MDSVRTKYKVDTELIRKLFCQGFTNYNVDQKSKTDTVSNFVKIEEVDIGEEINDNFTGPNYPEIIIDENFPLASMGVLALGSAHARPSARPPINTSIIFSAHMSGGGEIV